MGVFQQHHIPKKQTINGKDGVQGRNLSPVDVSHFSGGMSTLESFPADKRKHSLPYPPKKKIKPKQKEIQNYWSSKMLSCSLCDNQVVRVLSHDVKSRCVSHCKVVQVVPPFLAREESSSSWLSRRAWRLSLLWRLFLWP